MMPEILFPFFVAYAICASSAIFFSLFAIAVLFGLAFIDVWKVEGVSKQIKILLSIGLALFPEIGVMSWAIYVGQSRKIIFRIIAFLTSGLYILLQLSIFYASAYDHGLARGLGSALIMHFMWLPLILAGGAISFFVLRAVFARERNPFLSET